MAVEILSPCKNTDTLISALRSGCDAVYVGGKMFSARQSADNFTHEELCEAVKLCHKYGVKIYQAINTVATDDELPLLAEEIKNACEIGIDGIISQDLAVVNMVKKACPQMEIHASTQMTIHTPKGVDFAKEMGFSRVVVARELKKDEIRACCNRGVEIEAFVHGALCMSVSGQCYMSAMIGSRSANRGRCAQACRLPFYNHLKKGGNENALSLKDMCLVPYLKEMEEMGVSSLKIEGRMKRPEYVAGATDACKKSLLGEKYDLDSLKSVFSRSGFTDGYYTGRRQDMFGIRTKDDVLEANDVLPQLRQLYRKEIKKTDVKFFIEIKNNTPVMVEIEDMQGNKFATYGKIPEKAQNRSITLEMCEKQLSKLGDTIYNLREVSGDIDEGLSVSAGELNALRREACEGLDGERIRKNTKTVSFDMEKLQFFYPKLRNIKHRQLRLDVTKASQLRNIDFDTIDMGIVPVFDVENCEGLPVDRLAVSLPRFITDENALEKQLEKAYSMGINKAFVSNYAHITLCEKIGFELHGDFGLNVTNSMALEMLAKKNLMSATLSPELKVGQINTIGDYTRLSVVGYGKLPVMLTRNCPIGDCSRCGGEISDRTDRHFPIKCSKKLGYTEVLNCDTLWIADKLRDMNVDFVVLKFFEETPDEVRKITEKFQNGEGCEGKFTRGLYYRGIL
ncbi:MAG: U32 family peptidase [Oscillospiraceae bacterium]|nr:U32 family peptidase [Oscillospiraceae bacterium]